MSAITLSLPAGPMLPDVQVLFGAAGDVMHPVLLLLVLATVYFVFKPLLAGVVRAAVVTIVPRRSLEQRIRDQRCDGIRMLNRMAEDYHCSQPNLAAELRSIASRDR